MGDYRPTAAAEEAFASMRDRIEAQISRFETLISEELPGFNRLVAENGLGALVV